jgi:hypothetical protein
LFVGLGVYLGETVKMFHFQEMDWLIGFPNLGNRGKKYMDYSVVFTDRKTKTKNHVCLSAIIDDFKFEKNVPHTVGFFKQSQQEGQDCVNAYLEIRIIGSVEEFWKFLNDLDL